MVELRVAQKSPHAISESAARLRINAPSAEVLDKGSALPLSGTVVSHYPGLVTVDFELIGGQILRQRVPQDWVLLAATSREIKDVAWSLLETRWPDMTAFLKICSVHLRFGGRGGRRLWRVAKNKVYERIIRTHRQCAVLWKQRVELPEPGCRVSINCAMGLQAQGGHLQLSCMF
eukprot:g9076.t1